MEVSFVNCDILFYRRAQTCTQKLLCLCISCVFFWIESNPSCGCARQRPRRKDGKMLISQLAGPSSKLDRIIMTLRPDPLSELVKEPWDRQHAHADETQQARCPSNAQS